MLKFISEHNDHLYSGTIIPSMIGLGDYKCHVSTLKSWFTKFTRGSHIWEKSNHVHVWLTIHLNSITAHLHEGSRMWLTRLVTVVCLIVGGGYGTRTPRPRPPTERPTLIPTRPTPDQSIIPQGGCLHELLNAPIIQSDRRFLVSTKRGENRRSLLRKFGNTLDSPNSTVISITSGETDDSNRDLPIAVVNATLVEQVSSTNIQYKRIVALP